MLLQQEDPRMTRIYTNDVFIMNDIFMKALYDAK